MSRYFNADAFFETFGELNTEPYNNFPTADVVEVVRCKHCKWHGYLTCSNPDGIKGWVTDNDFCSYGEEREDECY